MQKRRLIRKQQQPFKKRGFLFQKLSGSQASIAKK
jgi:hypothetical protein